MKRYNKLKRTIRAEQEKFLEDVIRTAGFKVCTEATKTPEGHSVSIAPDDNEPAWNFILYLFFNVPVYMSVDKSSPTWKERAAQECRGIQTKLVEELTRERVPISIITDQFTDKVAIHVQV